MTDQPQHMQALERANATRTARSRQRRALQGAPAPAIYAVVVDPTPELASYKLGVLFAPAKNHRTGDGLLIPRFGRKTLTKALSDLSALYPRGRRQYHLDLRLRDLTRPERERVMRAITSRAPASWRAELETSQGTGRAEG